MIQRGGLWIRGERERHNASGRPLTQTEVLALSGFFESSLLASIRIVTVPEIANPDFYAELAALGAPMPLDLRRMAGITYDDTILVSQHHAVPPPAWMGLLFHEAVHVAQYSLLGIDDFLRRYVTGWARSGLDYYKIPLEQDAYQLGARFEAAPESGFPVIAELQARFAARGPAA
jgi:hypothetical protein